MIQEYLEIILSYSGLSLTNILLFVIALVTILKKRQVLYMYQFIYDLINNTLIGTTTINDTYISQLSIILTHISLILLYVGCVMIIIGLFRFVSSIMRF